MSAPRKPVPVPDEISAEFWTASSAHTLVMQQCTACESLAYPPRTSCTRCHSHPPAFRWTPVSGRGRLRTWTVMRTAFLPGFADDVPFVVGDVELEEQPRLRMAARLKGVSSDDLRLGMPVRVAFEDVEDGVAIPHFVPGEP